MLFDQDKELYDMEEKDLHNYFRETVENDFLYVHEATGVCEINLPGFLNKEVRADFLLYPKQHLIDSGFAETWFAIEIKRGIGSVYEASTQAFWYTTSKFKVKDQIITPGFALWYIPSRPKNHVPREKPKTYFYEKYANKHPDYREGQLSGLRITSQYLNVGWIELNRKDKGGSPLYIWNILFGEESGYARRFFDGCKWNKKDTPIHVLKSRKQFSLPVGNNSNIPTHSGLKGR